MQYNRELRELAQAYNSLQGLGPLIEGHYVEVDPKRARLIAAEYESLPVRDYGLDVLHAYAALAAEVEEQYGWLLAHGYSFTYTPDDPYPNSSSMMEELYFDRHIRVFQGGDPHPLLTAQANEHFRAVHDVFGHGAEGYQFGPRGEENAWVHHSMMFSSLAQVALTTETRGQNAWVNFGPHKDLPVTERPYAIQKAAILPGWCRMLPELALVR